jgi:hypothetical protein
MKLFAFLILVAISLAGCTMYEVTRDDGTSLKVRSTREFPEGIEIAYKNVAGAELTIKTGQVRNGASPLEELAYRALARQLDEPAPPAEPIADE